MHGTTQPTQPTSLLPSGCITASALRTLANTLDRLAAFHTDRGGQSPDAPCLRTVWLVGGTVEARVSTGERTFRLHLVRGAWEFAA